MALIVEGTTSKDITVAKPKATTTPVKKPTTSNQGQYSPVAGMAAAKPTTATTPAKTTTTVKPSAPKPVATVSKSTGGVKSTTMTPTSATKAAIPNITSTKPSTFAIQQGVKQNYKDKVSAPAPAASTLGIAKTAQTNVVSPTATGIAGGISNIPGQQVEPVNQGQYSPVAGMAAANIEQSQQVLDNLNAQYAPVDGMDVDSAREALQNIQNQDVSNFEEQQTQQSDALRKNTLRQGTGAINAPTPGASEYQGLQYDPTTGLALGGTPNAVGMFGTSTGNPYFDQLMSMKFDYDPAKDPEYINGAKVLENQVAQMMVGRGGLYSSVNQAALSSKLIEFQIALRKQKYEQYVQDRSFTLQMANTLWSRQDAAFNQYMTVAKYNADREDALFARQMQQEQLNLQRASAALAQQRYQAEVQAYESANQLNNLVSQVKYEQGMYGKLFNEWSKSGSSGASNNVAAYFGVTPGTKFNVYAQKYTVAKSQYIDSLTAQATTLARDMNELDIMQAALNGFTEQQVVPQTEYKYTQTVGDEGTTLRTEWSEYK